ncbi:MAG TPA: glycerol-3-phosphate 1-O-acyltransferase PlsY [Bryobacteraceae bacterium]|nr:glycerol-3-phosphate 1-O-acyltransferase PlsY [Bryobacteraceae bacterium]
MTFLLLLAAYFIGGIPFGYLLVRWRTGEDVRAKGSGNIGATNVLRSSGRSLGIATLLLDIAKGWFSVWLMARFGSPDAIWTSLAALAVILGHAFPLVLRFQGGKAVASFVGAFAYLAPLPLLAITILFVLVVAVTRFISLGSIIGAGLFPLAVWMIDHPGAPLTLAALAGGLFIIWRHKSNIERLRAGTENVFSFGKKKAA